MPITTAADHIHKYFFIVSRENKIDISCESSARQRIHMKQQALFCLKDESKKKIVSSSANFYLAF